MTPNRSFLSLIPFALALGAIAKEKAEVVEEAAKAVEPAPATRQQRRLLKRRNAKICRGPRG